MASLKDIEEMFKQGRFRAALLALHGAEPSDPSLRVFFAEALDETGESEKARHSLETLLASDLTEVIPRAAALRVLSGVHLNLGSPSRATDFLKESLTISEASGSTEEAGRAALALFSLYSNMFGPATAAPVLSTAKKYVLRSGNARLLAELHSRVGQADAQASSYLSARRHLSLALESLESDPHLGLLARANLALSSTYALVADNTAAVVAALAALGAAEDAGSSRLSLLCRANLAQLQLRADDLLGALANASEVLSQVSRTSPLRLAVLETLVASCLELDQADQYLGEIGEFGELMENSADHSWISVEAVPTYVGLLVRNGQLTAAYEALNLGIERSRTRSSTSNTARLALLKAEMTAFGAHPERAWDELERFRQYLEADPSADILATSERVKGIVAAHEGAKKLSRQQFGRAERVFKRCGLRLESRRTRELRKAVPRRPAQRPMLVRHAGQREVASGFEFLGRLAGYPAILTAELSRFVAEQGFGKATALAGDNRNLKLREGDRLLSIGPRGGKATDVVVQPSANPRSWQVVGSLATHLEYALRIQDLSQQVEQLGHFWDGDVSADGNYGLFISDEMRALLRSAQLAAKTDLPILILGETGTGKEILATEIHAASRRAKDVFIPFNVTAVSRELVESQLFGAKKGAFTGATSDTKGLFREADGGTIFLDEIGEMTLDLQPKLLRFVEQGEIQPVGERPQHVDVRIIAATNASLQDLVKQGRFREDLYHRLRVVPLTIPPLRERREEIATLARHFIAKHAESARRPVPDIAPRALERLVAADWPGNVRQLNNELKRVVALLPDDAAIEVEHLSPELQRPPSPQPLAFDTPTGRMSVNLDRPLDLVLEDVERATLERVMTVCSGNQSEAARRLGITRKGLYLKLKRMGLAPG